jgi:hypothetical protein
MYLIMWGFCFYVFAVSVTIGLGVPAYFIGKWVGLVRWWSGSVVGFVIGALAYLGIHLLLAYAYVSGPLNVAGLLVFSALGVFPASPFGSSGRQGMGARPPSRVW